MGMPMGRLSDARDGGDASKRGTHQAWVLVVDDDPDHRLMIDRALRRASVPVDVAQAGAIAPARARLSERRTSTGRDPMLVLLDLDLDGEHGLALLEEMRRHATAADLPVVVLSSSQSEEEVQAAYAAGANAYIRKPARYEELEAALDGALRFWAPSQGPPYRAAG